MMTAHTQQWSPQCYLKFEEERKRPSCDLLAMVPLTAPKVIVDLGCGPGNSTNVLTERYPEATIIGVDNSLQMVKAARKRLPKVEFIQANILEGRPIDSIDLLFAKADALESEARVIIESFLF